MLKVSKVLNKGHLLAEAVGELEGRFKIFLVEDDDKIANILKEELERYSYLVYRAEEYNHIKTEFLAYSPDLVVLDINLPRFDGYYWCRQIRTISKIPILIISARSNELDQVRAIENGADDFIVKPFNLELAMAKIRSALRRSYGEYAKGGSNNILQIKGVYLNRNQNTITFKNKAIELSPKEFGLLSTLFENAGEIVTREDLLLAIWDDTEFVDDNTLTVNVTRVRKKLEEIGLIDVIETKRGQGYKLVPAWED